MKQNSKLQPLAGLVGAWTTIGTHPMLPGRTFHGRTVFRWLELGAFLMMHMTIDEPEIPDGVAVFGSDDATPNEGAMLYFDVRGVSREYRWAVSDNVVTWSRRAPDFSQRVVLTLGADATTIKSQGEMSRDGVTWEPDLQLTYDRVSDAEFDASRYSTC